MEVGLGRRGETEKEERKTTKFRFNERWRDRDRAYEELPQALQETLLRKIEEASARIGLKKKRGPGRPRKLSDAEAAFLAAVREHHHQMPYRELATSSYAKKLGIKIHYTNLRSLSSVYSNVYFEKR